MGPADAAVSLDPADYGPPVYYRFTRLYIPTWEEASAGDPAGFDVDQRGDACRIPDYPGNVDNALIDLAHPLTPGLPEEVDMQEEIDRSLACPTDAERSVCRRLDLVVSVRSGEGHALLEIEDGEGETLTGVFVASVSADGELRAATDHLAIGIPYPMASGFDEIRFDMTNVFLTGRVSDTEVSQVMLGGFVVNSDFEAMVRAQIGDDDDIAFEDIAPILENLYDVELEGTCSALSVGFTGTATRIPSP